MSATFECNICGAENQLPAEGFARDAASCAGCRSTVRLRSLLCAFSVELFNARLKVPDFPTIKSIRGLGISDDGAYAPYLADRFDYRNTFYDREPRFDLTRPLVAEHGLYDFVLAGDVFEHVAPPVGPAFRNVLDLLKPDGFLALSVPYSLEDATREHCPSLKDYSLVQVGGQLALVNRTQDGDWQVFDRLVFHAGVGYTVELRIFSQADLRRLLVEAGSRRVSFVVEEYLPFGIVHKEICSLPVVAGKGPACLSREALGELALEYLRWKKTEARCHELSAHLKTVDSELEERTRWAVQLKAENDEFRRTLDNWMRSRWVQLGHVLGLGPTSARDGGRAGPRTDS